jgi:hypothetical protein
MLLQLIRLVLTKPLVSPRYLRLRRDSKHTSALSRVVRTNLYFGCTLHPFVDLDVSSSVHIARVPALLAFLAYTSV